MQHVFVVFLSEDPNNTISGPSSARQRNAISMAFRWRADDDPTFNAGLVALSFLGFRTSIAKKPFIFVIFQGGGRDPLSSPLDPPMTSQ